MQEAQKLPQAFAIPGLIYLPEYIDASAEAALIHAIDQQPWLNDLKRRVQHYGYRYDYKARNITQASKLGDIPTWLRSYCGKLAAELLPRSPDQVIVNEYQPGQGISAHIDCIPCFAEHIASISLGSKCLMEFTNTQTQEKQPLVLEPRSLLIFSGDARYRWKHAIPARKSDRIDGISPPCVSFSFSNKLGNADKTLGIRLMKAYLSIIAVKKHKQSGSHP